MTTMSRRGCAALLGLALALPMAEAAASAAPLGAAAAPAVAAPTQSAAANAPAVGRTTAPGLKIRATRTPKLVERDVKVTGRSTRAAARDYLEAMRGSVHISDPATQLRSIGTQRDAASLRQGEGRRVAERFEQVVDSVPVFGSGYVVRLTETDEGMIGTGASGHFWTGLEVDTTPSVSADVAQRVLRDEMIRKGLKPTAYESEGLTVVPVEDGLLAYQLRATGQDMRTGEAVVLSALVDAHTPILLSVWDGLQNVEPVDTTGTLLTGDVVPLDLVTNAAGGYDFIDLTRPTNADIRTYDANGVSYSKFIRKLPATTPLVTTPTIPVSGAPTELGAVDAQWGMGAVYDFYKDRLGRDSIDGKGGPMISVVNVTEYGKPYRNAFWDGTKMVFGGGGSEDYPYSIGLDVVAHEMTHGVTSNTSALNYFGESGAMNEGYSDYFGAAVEAEARGTSMDDPTVSLIGEDLCRTKTPVECAFRDIDDGSNTFDDYAGIVNDYAGVHINGPIYANALWNIRQAIDPVLADKVVYTTLTEYLTPTSDFVDGRVQTLAAARDLGLSEAEIAAVAKAFDDAGIVPDWHQRIGRDSTTLYAGPVDYIYFDYYFGSQPRVGGPRWVMGEVDYDLQSGYGVYMGRTTGKNVVTRVSPDDADWAHDLPDTDGESVVWVAVKLDRSSYRVWHKDLETGVTTKVFEGPELPTQVLVDGPQIAMSMLEESTFTFKIATVTNLGPVQWREVPAGGWLTSPSLAGNDLAFATSQYDEDYNEINTMWVMDLMTGDTDVVARPSGEYGAARTGQIVLTKKSAVWVQDLDRDGYQSVMWRSEHGRGPVVRTLVDEQAPNAPFFPWIDANDRALTYLSIKGMGSYRNETTPKLLQLQHRNGQVTTPAVRVSCNRGEQSNFAVNEGLGVAWLDATVHGPTLEWRTKPAGSCTP